MDSQMTNDALEVMLHLKQLEIYKEHQAVLLLNTCDELRKSKILIQELKDEISRQNQIQIDNENIIEYYKSELYNMSKTLEKCIQYEKTE